MLKKEEYIKDEFLHQKNNPNLSAKYSRYKNEFKKFGIKLFSMKSGKYQIKAKEKIIGTYVCSDTAKVIFIMFHDFILLAKDSWEKEMALLYASMSLEK